MQPDVTCLPTHMRLGYTITPAWEVGFDLSAAEQKWRPKPAIVVVLAPPWAHERVIYGSNTHLNPNPNPD